MFRLIGTAPTRKYSYWTNEASLDFWRGYARAELSDPRGRNNADPDMTYIHCAQNRRYRLVRMEG